MTPEDKHAAAVSGRAWDEFCDSLKSAGRIILENSTDDLDRVEGFRYLSRLTRGGLDSFLESGDPSYPRVNPLPNMLKIGCDNPDSYYQRVSVDPAHSYRITGPRGTVNYLSIGAYSGGYGAGAATPGNQGLIEDNHPDGTGSIDIVVSATQPDLADDQQWLAMSNETTIIIVRQFFLDRDAEQIAQLHIECLDPPAPEPPQLSGPALADGLALSGLFVHGVADRFVKWMTDLFMPRPNTLDFLPDDDHAGGWADPNQVFRHGYWATDEDQALVITVPAIEAYYWNFQLNNIWEESLDHRYHRVTVNKHTATYEPDGSCRIIVASRDPGVGNWIDTCEHHHGGMGLRYNQVVEDLAPTCEVVAAESVA
ncbi:MAG: DUF1214 domain-containing protein [Actinomycetota bacterium]